MTITAERVKARVAEFARERDALPDLDTTLMSPAEQRAVERQRAVLTTLCAKVPSVWTQLVTADARIADDASWVGALQAVRADFEVRLGKLDPACVRDAYDQRAAYRLQDALRYAIKAIDIGWSYDHNTRASVPPELEAALVAWGVRALPGKASVFEGRGSLSHTEERLVNLRAERAALAAFLERELAENLPDGKFNAPASEERAVV
jgi:hypothetical protein